MLFDASKKFYGHLKSARSRPKRSSQNVQKLDFENFVQNPSFSWAQFSLRLFCSTRPNAMRIRVLDSPDLRASIKNLKQCCLMCGKFFPLEVSSFTTKKVVPKRPKVGFRKLRPNAMGIRALDFPDVES